VEAELAQERERAAKEAEAARAAIAVKEAELQALEVERKARVSAPAWVRRKCIWVRASAGGGLGGWGECSVHLRSEGWGECSMHL